jgi:hypothetical protein
LDPRTIASGLRVPAAVGDFMISTRSAWRAARAAARAGFRWMSLATRLEGTLPVPRRRCASGVPEAALGRSGSAPTRSGRPVQHGGRPEVRRGPRDRPPAAGEGRGGLDAIVGWSWSFLGSPAPGG